MSFTTEISEEIRSLPLKKNCCRRAAALGLLIGAVKNADGRYTSAFYEKETAELAVRLLAQVFRCASEISETVAFGRTKYFVSFQSHAVADFLKDVETYDGSRLPHETAGFKCAGCKTAFLGGAFQSVATVTDPKKGYHMELAFDGEGKRRFVSEILTSVAGEPRMISRGNRFCLYYKNNGAIVDILFFMGCNKTSTLVANSFIKRDIRNYENRATNCDTGNILRAVSAAQKHINAIESLKATGRFESLPEELRYTAELRVENPDASLAELAALHEPPISKSGLNRRLNLLCEKAT